MPTLDDFQLLLNAAIFSFFVAGLIQPYVVVTNAFNISLWQVCSEPPATGCVPASTYYGCTAHAHRVKAVRAFGIMTVLTSALCAFALLYRKCQRPVSAPLGSTGASGAINVTMTEPNPSNSSGLSPRGRLARLCLPWCTALCGLIAMAIDVSLFTQEVCAGSEAAAKIESTRFGAGPKLMITGFALALLNCACNICCGRAQMEVERKEILATASLPVDPSNLMMQGEYPV